MNATHPAVVAQRRLSMRANRAGGMAALAVAEAPFCPVAAFRCACGAECVSHVGPALCSMCWARRVEARGMRRVA